MSHFVAIFDNEGKTVDRYTVYIGRGNEVDIYSMSDNPGHPQGFNQYSHTVIRMTQPEAHEADIKIGLLQLPEQVQIAIRERMRD